MTKETAAANEVGATETTEDGAATTATTVATEAPETQPKKRGRGRPRKSGKILATLVRGNRYFLGDDLFEKGVPQEVTPERRAHLEEHAVNLVTMHDPDAPGGKEHRAVCKFTFETV